MGNRPQTSNHFDDPPRLGKPYRYLWMLMLVYVAVLLMANWYDARIIGLYPVSTDAGTLIFPLSFLCSDIITEVYGYKQARAAIWMAFALNLIFLIYGIVITHLPSPDFAMETNRAFDRIIQMNLWIILASVVSYFCGEPLNALLVAKLKIRFAGRYMAFRFFFSTFIAAFIDSLVFSVIAFSHLFPFKAVMSLALTMWLIKVIVELCGLPLSVALAKRLKVKEQSDIYDIGTNFSLFQFEAGYAQNRDRYCAKR